MTPPEDNLLLFPAEWEAVERKILRGAWADVMAEYKSFRGRAKQGRIRVDLMIDGRVQAYVVRTKRQGGK